MRLQEDDRQAVDDVRELVVNPGGERPIPLAAVAEHPSSFEALAKDARAYVEAHYRPDVVLDQLEDLLGRWTREVAP